MAKYNGPVCRLCRREGEKLFLKGERCLTEKCGFERRAFPPGQHGTKRNKLSEFGTQLREKQKVRRVYGMMEKPFRNLFIRASKIKGVTAEIFFRHLELRLDNAVYRMGFARSRQEGKRIVRHGHILVNGKSVNLPGVQLDLADVVSVHPTSKQQGSFTAALELASKRTKLNWFEVDAAQMSAKVNSLPTRDDIQLNVKERYIVELYNK